ncbi:hypothetical protein D3C85_1943850 [compost metagenome]
MEPNLKVVDVWLFPMTVFPVFGMVNILKSTPVLFCKIGLLVPTAGTGYIEELKKLLVVFPA